MLLDLGDGAISGNSTLLKQFTNLITIAYDDVVAEIMKNEGEWAWDDNAYGNSNLPTAVSSLTTTPGSEVSNYALPVAASPGSTDISSLLRVRKVYVKDSGGYYQNVNYANVRDSEFPLETQYFNPGFPKWYRLVGNSIILYPAPLAAAVTATNGLKIEFERDKVDFVSTDTTKQPGFPAIHHPLLAYFASAQWAGIKGLKQLSTIQAQIQKMYQNLGWNIANRNQDFKQRIVPIQTRRNPYNE